MFDASKFTVKIFDEPEDYEERKKWRKEKFQKAKKEKEEEIQKFLQEFQYPYNHPIPESVRNDIAKLEYVRSIRNDLNQRTPHWQVWSMSQEDMELLGQQTFPDTSNPIYIIDKELDIIDWVPTRNAACNWVLTNNIWYKHLGRTTMYEYIKNRWLYKKQIYFVPVKEYEEFIEEKLKKVS